MIKYAEEQLILTILDFFSAGVDTTSNSIGSTFAVLFSFKNKTKIILFYNPTGFAFLYLIHHPTVQQKMQVELDAVCGTRLPSFEDRFKYVS